VDIELPPVKHLEAVQLSESCGELSGEAEQEDADPDWSLRLRSNAHMPRAMAPMLKKTANWMRRSRLLRPGLIS
jgi:hypothetical protein